MATSDGETSALIYLDFTGEERPCVWRDGEPRPPRASRRAAGPALMWIDQSPEG